MNEDAQFLAELAATLSENYHHNGQEERLPKIPTSVRERPRIIQGTRAHIQIDLFIHITLIKA